MTIYGWIISAFWIVFLLVWFISAFGAKRTIRRSTKGMIIRIVIFTAALVLLHGQIFNPENIRSAAASNPILNVTGVILCGAGIAFAIWARFNIGKNWGMPMSVKENPELVTSGPYAYVRHPIYTGILFAILGSALTTNFWWLIVLIVFGSYFVFSATREEKLMAKEFPNQYPEYKKRTKMLIPFVL